jgi:SAM-dependent methyltransferase
MNPVCLDLGCGTRPQPGFFGVDRFALPKVSVVADLNRLPLPFVDNCADCIYACHSLEHVDDLLAVVGEIWRIGKPRARVVIVAPYGYQGLNLANPYHKQFFNEHSPRFWTTSNETGVAGVEYHHPPHGSSWGLGNSDHSDIRFDLRCCRMEFLYFDEYRNLNPDKLRYLRRKHSDVCDQILYELEVFKTTPGIAAACDVSFCYPDWLTARRGPLPRTGNDLIRIFWRTLRSKLHP